MLSYNSAYRLANGTKIEEKFNEQQEIHTYDRFDDVFFIYHVHNFIEQAVVTVRFPSNVYHPLFECTLNEFGNNWLGPHCGMYL